MKDKIQSLEARVTRLEKEATPKWLQEKNKKKEEIGKRFDIKIKENRDVYSWHKKVENPWGGIGSGNVGKMKYRYTGKTFQGGATYNNLYTDTELQDIKFIRHIFQNNHFLSCDFMGCSFINVLYVNGSLKKSTFTNCLFKSLKAKGADFTGASFASCIFEGCDLTKAKGLTKIDSNTLTTNQIQNLLEQKLKEKDRAYFEGLLLVQ